MDAGNPDKRASRGGLGSRARLRTAAFAAAVFALAAGLYMKTLSYGFVYDDKVQVLSNYWLKDTAYLPEIFSSGVWGFVHMATNYYRPMMHTSYMAAYHLFGLSPWGFHLLNVLANAGTAIVVFFLTGRLIAALAPEKPVTRGKEHLPAFIAASLFAAHPVHVETVAWVAGLPDIGFTFFALLSLYLYIRPDPAGPQHGGLVIAWRYPVSAACYLLAALFKEPALGLPLVFVAYDIARARAGGHIGGHMKRYAPYAAAAGVYMLARVAALGGFAPNPGHQGMSAYELSVNAAALFGRYIVKLVLPTGLSAYHEFLPAASLFDPAALPYVIAAAVFFAAAAIAYKKDGALFVGLAMVLVPLLPALYIPGVGKNAFAERYLYMPSAGLAFIAALLMHRARGRGMKVVAVFVSAAVVLAFGAATLDRSAAWKDDLSLWSDAVSSYPDSAAANDALGLALEQAGRKDEAEARFLVAMASGRTEAFVHLGNMHNRAGEHDKAAVLYKEALTLEPENAYAHNNLGVVYAKKGMLDEALAEFEAAIKSDPYYLDARKNLARAYAGLGRRHDALKCLVDAMGIFPHERDDLMMIEADLKRPST